MTRHAHRRKRKKKVKDCLSGSLLIGFADSEVPFEYVDPLYQPLMKEGSLSSPLRAPSCP